MLALDRWRKYLIDRPFLVLTDHHALKYLMGKTLFSGRRLLRWQMLLGEFQISVQHHAGARNGLADALSRLFETNHRSWDSKTAEAEEDIRQLSAAIAALPRSTEEPRVQMAVVTTQRWGHVLAQKSAKAAQAQLFRSGSLVWVSETKWGRPWPGKVLRRHRKNAKGKVYYVVECEAMDHEPQAIHVLEQYLLSERDAGTAQGEPRQSEVTSDPEEQRGTPSRVGEEEVHVENGKEVPRQLVEDTWFR